MCAQVNDRLKSNAFAMLLCTLIYNYLWFCHVTSFRYGDVALDDINVCALVVK